MYSKFFTRLLGTLTFLSLSTPLLADTKLTYTDYGFGPQERKTTIQIHGDKVRMEEVDSGIYTLYDNTKKTLFTVNTKTKQYIETTPEKVRERVGKLLEAQHQPPGKQTEAAMEASAPSITMEKTTRSETIQGVACHISSVSIDGKPRREVCIAGSDAVDAADHAMLLAMFEFMDGITAESAKAMGVAEPNTGFAFVHKDGLAIRIQAIPEGPRSELASLSNDTLDDADFVIPTGFTAFEPDVIPPTPPKTPSPATTTDTQ